jgi:N-acetyl-anhydromuramyl-L-alanine amidase AmpD
MLFPLMGLIAIAGCAHPTARVGQRLERQGDEIVVAGQFFHTGTPVVLWMDPGGYDAYRTERRFAPWDVASYEATTQQYKGNKERVHSPNRLGLRFAPTTEPVMGGSPLTPRELEQVRGGGWPLKMVQDRVDQFVYHYDVAGVSRRCFLTLHDDRGLSVHFMCDVDGTIYQTMDLKERAWHATSSNNRSVGIEIANIGAYPVGGKSSNTLEQWYRKDTRGRVRMVLPAWARPDGVRTPGFVARPMRERPVEGTIQGARYRMYDLTSQQYEALIKLTATLCTVLPKIKCDYPRDENGDLITHVLPKEQLAKYQGLMGHYHVQDNKQDPGPAFQWDLIVGGARKLMGLRALKTGDVNNPSAEMVAERRAD